MFDWQSFQKSDSSFKIKKIIFPTVNFCFYIILAIFHFHYFWVNFGRNLSMVLILI